MKIVPSYILLFLLGSVFIVYMNSLRGTFLFDDYAVIVGYAPVHDIKGWLRDLNHGIRPFLKLTYTMNWASGMGAPGFHLFNILTHALNTVMVYLLGMKLSDCWPAHTVKGTWNSPALLAALLFALHPIQTEAVTYISGRSSSLMSLFYLGALLSYIYGREKDNSWWIYAVSPFMFLLAMLTKETAITLPFVLVLWESVRKSTRWYVLLKKQSVHWALFILLIISVVAHPRYARLLWISMDTRSLHDNLLSQINGVTYLLSRLILINRLNIDPDLPVVNSWNLMLILQVSILVGMVVLALLTRRKRPWIWFGALWFFLILLPTNSVIPRFDIASERHLYLACFGIFFPISMELSSIGILESKHGRIGIIALLLMLAAFTVARNRVYGSNINLWEDTALKSPNKTRVYNNLGYSYELHGDREKAIAMYDKALWLNPANTFARRNLMRVKGETDVMLAPAPR